MKCRYPLSLIFLSGVWLLFSCAGEHKNEQQETRPNIILIMADDLGFSDISSYGSEIPTPNIDRLAQEGIRFRQFYNMSKCETTRSVLFTGHYQGDAASQSIVGLSRAAGYTTLHFGKEHFQNWVPDHCYAAETNEKSLTFWATTQYFVPPGGVFDKPFLLDGVEVDPLELDCEIEPFFKTDVFTDYAIRYLDKALERNNPFFLTMPYHAPHYPLQAREDDIARFRGQYLIGWDSIRQKRYEKMIELGVLKTSYPLSEPSSNINRFRGHPKDNDEIRAKIPLYRPWNELTEDEKDALDLEMAVYAAMVYRMDLNIGRILDFLDERGIAENTIVMFLSDNGACPYDSNRNFDFPPGGADSYRTQSAAWANASNTPFRFFKQFGHEGGTHTPFLIRWPAVIKKAGTFVDHPGHVVDIFPTLLDVTEAIYPNNYNGKAVLPLDGQSLLPVLQGKEADPAEFFISGHTDRFRMFRKGDWKIVRTNNEAWELYNLKEDLTETTNLFDQYPEIARTLLDHYNEVKANHKARGEAE